MMLLEQSLASVSFVVGEVRAKSDAQAKPGPFTVAEVAALLGVCADTVRSWCDEGSLSHFRTPGGHRRIPASAIDELVARLTARAA